ncbi:hypothetical protein JTB14_002835 [Gonioctena quinquepunctata]|nr:hypothetical protein JTB14_002835 [Gonioctena quinquepunctata]
MQESHVSNEDPFTKSNGYELISQSEDNHLRSRVASDRDRVGPPGNVEGTVLRRYSANMPRVRWCGATHSVLSVLGLFVAVAGVLWSFWIVGVEADCWYDDEKYEEGTEVSTAEPCLNCTCSRGALLCYLRVCPKFPDPPPSGCILLHRYRTCCSELICPEFAGFTNAIESRSEPEDDFDISFDTTIMKSACISNGSIYGPGSAMDTSSSCEYCYCLGGKQTCIKPKCLLPVEGCTPIFDPSYCCPIHYNCKSHTNPTSVSTTSSTTTEQPYVERGGCIVDGTHYPEGGKVLGFGHAVCDNCYCLKSLVRCEPLSCAPPLLGCSPVIKPGECCAASYNCSGTIEIQPEPFYGHFPIISKEYAKLRKEVIKKRPPNFKDKVTVSPMYYPTDTAHSKQRSPGTFGTTRHFNGVPADSSTSQPYHQKGENSKLSTGSYLENKERIQEHTNVEFKNNKSEPVLSTTIGMNFSEQSIITNDATSASLPKEDHMDYLDFIQDNIFSLFDSPIEDKGSSTDNRTNPEATTTIEGTSETTTLEILTTTKFLEDNSTEAASTNTFDQTTEITSPPFTETTTNELPSNISYPLTVRSVLKSTDCIQSDGNAPSRIETHHIEISTMLPVDANQVNELAEVRKTVHEDDFTTTEVEDSSETTTEDHEMYAVEVEGKVRHASVTVRNIPDGRKDIDVISNKSTPKISEYDYDYSEPTLPPSLPNLRIIPFVAEDALDIKKELSKEDLDYPQERIIDTDTFGFHNHFSPPVETEGGFIPKDPPILDNFYGNAVTVSSTFDEAKPIANCVSHDGTEVAHGQSVASDSPCVTCTCFYGNIACQKPNCPIPRPNCRKSLVQDLTLCCPRYVCGNEAPTVVLDRLNVTDPQKIITVAERSSTPDPFRDVIRTELAPNLQSLIIDRVPYLNKKTTTRKPEKEHAKTAATTVKTTTTPPNDLSLDKVLQLLLFPGEKDDKTGPTTTKIQTKLVDKTADRPSTVSTTPMPSVEEKPGTSQQAAEDSSNLNRVDSGTGSALFINLAGCNIYGRMYRVGRIISELSGPCQECKCTEIGVHCEELC